MKIVQKSKRTAPPHPQVAALVSRLLETPTDDLADVLAEIDNWKWPRSDLNAWVKVLNKFDTILEDLIRDYGLDSLQINVFTPSHKKQLCEVLRFERLLLENSTNRKLFNSYDRLSSLLFTSDLDVLVYALNLLLRPAQQYSSQHHVLHALNISTTRLQSLAKRWPNLREHGIDLVDLVGGKAQSQIEGLPAEASEVNYTFYRRGAADKKIDKEKDGDGDVIEGANSSSPRKTATVQVPTSGAVNIHLGSLAGLSTNVMTLLADAVDSYDIPENEKFELLCRIRTAAALGKGKESDREKLVIIRLLAVAIFAHTHTEAQAASALFLYEPDLITHIGELLQLDRAVPIAVQTAAIAALDGLARYPKKPQDVLAAVNAGVNHGILMALLRKTVADLSNPDSSLPHSFIDALLSFVTYIASHAAGGNMVVGAGLVPLLIQVIENRLPHRLLVVSKTMQLVDNVLYGFTNAFQLFCSGRGVEVLVDRIEFEVDFNIREHGDQQDNSEPSGGTHGHLPFDRSALLKHILRSMQRMMQSSGTTEGLRGLIDSSLLKSVKKIIDHRGLFGPTVLPIAVNIMATFVHNEPTSLTVIQEAGLPEAFYKAIESGLEPVIEVIQAIPNAIGALCLNQAGQDQLAARPTIIPGFFSIFTSDRHLKVLQDKENAALIGSAVDELIRHHPTLKAPVFESLKSTLSKIEVLGYAFVEAEQSYPWYTLCKVPAQTSAPDEVPMEDIESGAEQGPRNSGQISSSSTSLLATANDESTAKLHENVVVSYLDVVGRFLEGLFQHTPHCKDFISNTDGLDRFGRLTALPCLPVDFGSSPGSDSLVQVMRTMAEVSPTETLLHLAKSVKASLEDTKDFWSVMQEESKLLPMLDITTDEEVIEANQRFRRLVTLHIRTTLLSDVYATAGYAHGRAAIGLLQNLTGPGSPEIIPDLGSLHRACLWENIILKEALTSRAIAVASTPVSSPVQGSPRNVNDILPDVEAPTANVLDQSDPASSKPETQPESKTDSAREHNAKALRHLASQIPASLAPFFQATVKMFMYGRRNPDAAQKKQAVAVSFVIADVMLKHLRWQGSAARLPSYAYDTVMIGLIMILLFDERTAQNSLHTMLLVAFRQAGGLEAIFAVSRRYTSAIDRVTAIKTEERSEADKQELIHVFGGLKVALHLLHSLVSSKPLFESGQTQLLITRDKKETEPDYFEPHHFLVKMRLEILPLVRDLWLAQWLIAAPIGISKTVAQAVLELVSAENEEYKGDQGDLGITIGAGGVPRPSGPDENRIQQLTDMGFPRSAAERALIRAHNNVNAATEFLLAQPFPFPPDEPVDEESAPAPSVQETAQQDDMSPVTEEPLVTGEPAKSLEVLRNELNDARAPLKLSLGRQTLRLVDEHPSLIFDVRAAFTIPSEDPQADPIRCLIDDIKAFSPFAYDVQEQPLGVRCHLLALVLNETRSPANRISKSDAKDLMDVLVALLLSSPIGIEPEPSSIPKWLSRHLLVAELLLMMAEEPRSIVLPKDDDPIVHEDLTVGPPYLEARSNLFDLCLRLLAVSGIPRDEFLSVLRLLVELTRDHNMAVEFVRRDGLTLLLQRFREPSGDGIAVGSHSYIAIILRHVIEDKPTVENIMRQELRKFFSQPRNRVVDVATFVRNCSQLALRDPRSFVNITAAVCELSHPYSAVQHISLKTEDLPVPVEGPISELPDPTALTLDTHMQTDLSVEQSTPGETLETVIHFLLSELTRVAKSAVDESVDRVESSRVKGSEPTTIPHEGGTLAISSADGQLNPTATNGHADYLYSCFIMQCLTELLFSYDSCKIAFLSYSKKRTHTPAKDNSSKYRTAALNFLLSDLISVGGFNPENNPNSRKRLVLCNGATSVIVALCMDTSSAPNTKDLPSDLVSVRKFVLEAISRAIKDTPPVESAESRYGRLFALADLCNRLLIVRFGMNGQKLHEDSPLHIAKIMLEKNFVATLTNALSEVDLNYPAVRTLVTAILKPLEHLTKVAIKMGRTSDKGKDHTQEKDESVSSVVSSEEDDDDMEDNGREETPDLYRNSSLGMYGGEMGDTQFSAEDEMDQDEGDEDEDVDMDFGEETGSEDTSNTDDDVEEEVLDITAGSEEGWQDEDEDDDDEDEDDDDDDEGAVENHAGNGDLGVDEEGGEEEDDEIMWQDVPVGLHHIVGMGEDPDDEEDMGDAPIIEEEADEEAEIISDADIVDELGILDVAESAGEDGLGWRSAFMGELNEPGMRQERHGFLFTGAGLPIRRRSAHIEGDPMDIFGRPRNPTAGPEAPTHPLLVEAAPGGTIINPGQTRASQRRAQRTTISGDDFNVFLQAIEELVGDGAAQVFQNLLARTSRGGRPEEVHLAGPPPGLIANLERGHPHRHGRHTVAASFRLERVPRPGEHRPGSQDSAVLLTMQRWLEEVKTLHGRFVADRLSKLSNHVALALLPAARERAKSARLKEEKEAEERRIAQEQEAREQAELTAQKEKVEAEARVAAEAASEAAREAHQGSEPSATVPTIQDLSPHDSVIAVPADQEPMIVDTANPPPSEDHVNADRGVSEAQATVDAPPEPSTSESAGPSIAPERITVMIHGSAVDISDTGIDPTFLEALPDDMREEVLNQHFRDRRASRIERPPDSQISPEFLAALPPEIRAEILHQEGLEQSRRRREEAAATSAEQTAGPADMDPASFLASLDPQLRQVVLLDSEDTFIQTLPSHMIAEAGVYRDGSTRAGPHLVAQSTRRPAVADISQRKPLTSRDAIQLLDRGAVATLVRLIFFPQLLRKNHLHQVLVNLCENSKTRSELFNLLLSVLQDGTGDLAAVDKSFAQMSFRNSKIPTQATPKSGAKQKPGSDYFGVLPIPQLPNETVPDLIAHRCLDALTFIVSNNEVSSLFFLTEHELPVGLRRTTSKKGKGKERQAQQTHYPIVLLLGLLDRQSLLKTPSIMDSVANLLATVTRPLTLLKDVPKDTTVVVDPPVTAQTSDVVMESTPDVPVADVPTTAAAPTAVPTSETPPAPSAVATQAAELVSTQNPTAQAIEGKALLTNPPQIPPANLRLVVNILTVGECSGRTFQQTLALIQHLSCIPDARDIIAQELRSKAQEFGQSLFSDLDELARALQDDSTENDLPNAVAAKFSPASSDQAKLLRVLKTIDYMYSPKMLSPSVNQPESSDEKVYAIYETFRFTPLWRRLGDCLAVIEQKPDFEHITTVLLPLIESLMVVCKYVGSKTAGSTARALRASASPRSPSTPRESMEDLFVSFTDAHRKVLNLMVRNNPSLMSGSFSLLVQNPRVLDFDNKRNYFNQQLHRRPHSRDHHGTLQLNVRRPRVFEDSFQYLQRKTGEQIKYGKLSVRFYDEEGVDAGGVTREWFQILARQMFNPDYALFQPCAADKLTYQPNRASWVNPEHLAFFKFVGRVIGKAIYDGRLLDAYFARSLYKQLLGKPVDDYKDVEWVDPEYYNSLCWILENDPSPLDLTFSIEANDYGVTKIVPLKENGATTLVTQENKREFVQLSAQYRLSFSIKDQIEALLGGFYEIIPKDLISIFNEQEVELLISGTPDIDVDEWRAATEYNGYSSSDPTIVWWWRALKSFNREERAKVLSFATGTSRVPLGGFVDLQGVQGVQRFSIHRAYGDSDRLPQAHTCFNQIDLPQYSSYEKLRQQLLFAISEGGEGFGFA